MNARRLRLTTSFAAILSIGATASRAAELLFTNVINVTVPHISTDKSVRYDYDIVYVRAPRAGDEKHKRFYTDFSQPVTMEPGADLMLRHPDGREELLVAGGDGSITDPMVSFDGQWVYFSHLHNLQKASQWSPQRQGADILKIHAKSRRIVKLTGQAFTPNTGAVKWAEAPVDFKPDTKNAFADDLQFEAPAGSVLFVDELVLFEPVTSAK